MLCRVPLNITPHQELTHFHALPGTSFVKGEVTALAESQSGTRNPPRVSMSESLDNDATLVAFAAALGVDHDSSTMTRTALKARVAPVELASGRRAPSQRWCQGQPAVAHSVRNDSDVLAKLSGKLHDQSSAWPLSSPCCVRCKWDVHGSGDVRQRLHPHAPKLQQPIGARLSCLWCLVTWHILTFEQSNS